MARQIRRFGPWLLGLGALAGLLFLLLPPHRPARAATFTSPIWTLSATLECPCTCDCNRPPNTSPEGVNYISTALNEGFFVASMPGVREDYVLSLLHRGEVNGSSQFGFGMLAPWSWWLDEVNATTVKIGDATGHIVTLTESGGVWGSSDCAFDKTLTEVSAGIYELWERDGTRIWRFTSDGDLDYEEDGYGNRVDYTWSSAHVLGSFTDTRGGTWTVHTDQNGFIDYVDDPSSRRFTFTVNGSGVLTEIGFPATTDQSGGTTIQLGWDGYLRLTGITDQRANLAKQIAYVGATLSVDTVTLDDDDVTFDYPSGRVERTDRAGVVHRIHVSGQNITQTDLWISSQAKYVTSFSYSGAVVTTIVNPEGGRIDYTYNNDDQLVEVRKKETDTASTSASDIVDEYTWSNYFLASHTDPLGEVTTFTRNTQGDVTRVDFADVSQPVVQTAYATRTYNADGQLTEAVDEEGKKVTFEYYSTGDNVYLLHKRRVDPDGLNLTTTYDYDAWFNVDSVQDPLGGTTTYTFDTLRRKKQATSPSPLSIDQKWAYSATDQVVTYEVENLDKDGASVTANPWITTTYTYTVLGDLASLTEEIGDGSTTRTTSFSYNASQQQTLVTMAEGNKVETQYNERGLASKVIYGQGSLVESDVEYFYDDDANLTVVRDGRNNDTTTTYDAFGRRVKVEDPLGHYTTYTLDKRGQVTEEARKDSGDNTLTRRSFYYDERGRLWKTSDLRKDPGTTYSDAVTTIKRKKTGHVYEVVDPLSRSTLTTFDAAWRRTAIQDAMGNETTWTLNANGWPTAWSVKEVDGQSAVTHQYEATYDALGRRLTLKEIDRTNSQNSITTTSGYDSRGNLVWQVNELGDPTRYTFDAAGRMTMKEVALSTGQTIEDFTTKITTTWAFDKNDRLTSHKDDAQNTSTWAYDAKDRVTVLTYPDSSTVSYTLDAADNVTQVIDAIGNDIDDTYNANNWRTARTVTRATGVIDTTSESFSYDGLGRLTAAEDNDYKVEFTYAVLGHASMPYEEKQSFVGGTAYTKTVTKTYNAAAMKVSELYPSGLDLDYTWNDIDRMATVTDGTSTIASFAYIGRRSKTVTYQNGTTANYAWGPYRSQVLGVNHKDSGTNSLLNLQYGYDSNHDRLYERFGASGSSGDAFAYDMARRLTTAWMGSATPSNPTSAAYVKKIEYNMDDDGNRSSVVVTPYQQSSSSTSYTDNSLNQYTAVGGVNQSHDGNGNLKDDGTYLYEYNYRSLLCRVKLKSDNSTVATYKYDALGRRVEKDLGTTRERYVYSGLETVSVYDSSDTWVRDFVFGEGIDEPLMLRQADVTDFDGDQDTSEVTRHFYHRNALGSVLLLTDMNEAEGVSYRYDPYGAVSISVGGTPESSDPLGNPWMFTSRFQDEETGLIYYRARQYAPGVGRFLQRDPLGYSAGSNLFAYAYTSPSVYTDPLGLQPPPPPAPQSWADVYRPEAYGSNPTPPASVPVPELNTGRVWGGPVSRGSSVTWHTTETEDQTIYCPESSDILGWNALNRMSRDLARRGLKRDWDPGDIERPEAMNIGCPVTGDAQMCVVYRIRWSRMITHSADFASVLRFDSDSDRIPSAGQLALKNALGDVNAISLMNAVYGATQAGGPKGSIPAATGKALAAEAYFRGMVALGAMQGSSVLKAMYPSGKIPGKPTGWSPYVWTGYRSNPGERQIHSVERLGRAPCPGQVGPQSMCDTAMKEFRGGLQK